MYPPVPPVSFSTINCNSLNMSSLGMDNHLLKIHGIVSLNSDIIFLSDIRLCNTTGTSNLSIINNSFRCEYEPKNFEQDPTGTLKMLYLDGEMSKNRIVVLLTMSKHRTENNLYPLKKIFKIDEVEKSINFYFDTIIQQSQLEDKE